MSSRFFQKSLGSKVIAGVVIANLIFTGNVFALDSLRASAAKEARDGGTAKDITRDLKIATDGGEVADVSFLRIVPQNVHEGEGDKDVGLGFTIRQLLALGLESTFLGHTSTRGAYIREETEKTRATSYPSGSGRFDDIINKRIEILRGFVTREQFEKQNLNSEALFSILIEKGYLTQYWRVNPEFTGLDDDFKASLKSSLLSYNDKQIKQIEAILQQALSTKKKIKEIHLGVGSVRKNIDITEEKDDIEVQLALDLKHITIDDLKEINFNISYEPSPDIDITKLTDEKLIGRIQEVHQRIYWWFAHEYGAEEINAIWGKSLKIWFRGSVNKVNANAIMSVKVITKEGKKLPGVHGVVFATSGKDVEGYLGVAQVVQEAAKRDSKEYGIDFQYGILVNFKSITADDKERTPPDEYVNRIYAALNGSKLDRNYIIAEVAPPDVELEKWLELVAKAEAPEKVRASLGWEPSVYGPHPMQEGLRPLYEKISWARNHAARAQFVIKNIYAFRDQKHGMAPVEAISFGIVLGDDTFVVQNAPVMGGLSAGGLEPDTHPNIEAAIEFFNENVSPGLKGLSIAQPDGITGMIIKIDEEFKKQSEDKTLPRFSYIGAELAVGISMISTIALAEVLHVPAEVIINYRYNEYAMSHGLAKEPRPISIPVDFSVVWEGGKHGVAKHLPDLVRESIIKDDSRFPARFKDAELINKGDKSVLLAMVPPQELQILCFAPDYALAYDIGVKLTKTYQKLLKDNGIKTKYGAESGFTTEQTRTADGKLITLELVLDILEKAVSSLEPDEAKYVRFALDIAASEMYIPEIDMYYIGPDAAKKVDPANVDGLVTNEQFTQYKLMLFKAHPRFISCEDWAADDQIAHWDPSAKLIMEDMIQMGDDVDVSRADLIRKHNALGIQNAHLHKPNQVSEEQASMEAVGTSHNLKNVVVWSHRGTRSPQETFTAQGAMGTGSFGSKFTLWGPGRSALIAIMSQANKLYTELGVNVPYQGALALDPNGPYKDYGWAIRLRKEIGKEVEAAKIKTEYIQAEDTVYSVSGGGALDNLVEGILEKARETLKKPVLKVSAEQKKEGNLVQTIWQFAGITIRRNFKRDFFAAANDVKAFVEKFNELMVPVFKENNLILRKEAYDKRAIELTELSGELSETTRDFVKKILLPKIEEELFKSKRIERIEEEPHVFIVPPNVFKKGGIRDIIRKVSELDDVVNIKFAFYGYKTKKLNDIIGIKDENIITTESLDDLLKEFSNRNIGPAKVIALITPEDKDTDDNARLREAGIRQILVSDIVIPAAAKAVNELYREIWGDIGAGSAFAGFLDDMVKIEVISPISKDIRREIAAQIGISAIFTFPKEFEPDQKVIETIEEVRNKEAFKKIVEEFI